MKCLRCGEIFEDSLSSCPNCGYEGHKDLEDVIELPALKDDYEKEEDTDSFNYEPVDPDTFKSNEEENEYSSDNILSDLERESSLEEPIVTEIEEDNSYYEESPKEEDSYENDVVSPIEEESTRNEILNDLETENSLEGNPNIESVTNVLESKESLNSRKKILLICVILTVIALVVTFTYIFSNKDNATIVLNNNYISDLTSALDTYYKDNNTDELIKVLESNKTDPDRIANIQSTTKNTFITWLEDFKNENITTVSEFNSLNNKYQDLLDGLYTIVTTTYENETIACLSKEDYEELKGKLDEIYEDSNSYFEALEYYNNKDYNKAYVMLDELSSSNTYYEKAQSYLDKIIEEVLELMKTDIKNIEKDIDTKTDSEKKTIYLQIVEVIENYAKSYKNIPLNDNTEYLEILNEYKEKTN